MINNSPYIVNKNIRAFNPLKYTEQTVYFEFNRKQLTALHANITASKPWEIKLPLAYRVPCRLYRIHKKM